MPNIQSAIRRAKRSKIQTTVNRLRKSKYRSAVKKMSTYLDSGKILECGTYEELISKKESNFYRASKLQGT